MSEPPLERDAEETPPALATTAYHMADAVGYLIWVANEANMRKVATHLAEVRVQLLLLADEEDEDNDWHQLTPPN